MFVLKKGIAAIALPPGIFILIMVLIGLNLIFSRRFRIGLISLGAGILLWAMSVGPVANFLMRGLEAGYTIPAQPAGDVMVLLGGGIIDRVPDLTGTGVPSPLMMGRVVTAVRLHRRLPLPIIVTGGRGLDDDGVAEATVVKRFLVDLGIPGNGIIEEGQARDTAQNARFTAAICQEKGYHQPILVTAAYHLKRSVMLFEAAGLHVTPFPAYFLGVQPEPYQWRQLLPHATVFYISACAIHEYVGLLYYRIIGI